MVAALTSFLLAEEGDDTEFLDLEVHGWQWAILGVAIVALLAIDLYRHREAHAPTFSEASKESAFWVLCGVSFALFFVWQFGGQAAKTFKTSILRASWGHLVTKPRKRSKQAF